MMAGGKDGVVKVAGAARRPSIRPKPVTPPRADARLTPTWTLPPVRTPAPRVAKRPVLVLVDQDETFDDVACAVNVLQTAPWWQQPRSIALVVASVLAAAFATTAVVWTAIARRDAETFDDRAVSTTTISSASLTIEKPLAPPVAPRQHEVTVPVVDVNSLPAAPSRMATSSAR